MIFRKPKWTNKRNSGNKSPRNQNQRMAAIKLMILKNPMKNPKNQLAQSHRMVKNQYWKLRKRELIKRYPFG
jgi:hypothetical protein